MTSFQKYLVDQIQDYRRQQVKASGREDKSFISGIIFGLKLAFNKNSKTSFDTYEANTRKKR